MRRCSCW